MRIAELNRTVVVQKLKSSADFYGDAPEVETSFSTYAHVTDKGISETDGNGHVHEARELLITLRSYRKTRAIRPDMYQLFYMEELYDITQDDLEPTPLNKIALLFTMSYLFEHREDAELNQLKTNLRALLEPERKAAF